MGHYTVNGAVANTTHPISVALRNTFGSHLFQDYHAHEENTISNSSDQIIAYWSISAEIGLSKGVVAMYEHPYQKGSVIAAGVMALDILMQDKAMQYFLLLAMGMT